MLATHLGHLAGDHRGEYLMTDGQERVAKLLEQVVTDLGATMAAGSIIVAHRLGLYRALAEGPVTPPELAARSGPIRGTSPNG